MDNADLLDRVRTQRALGLSSKLIARKLGVPQARVAPLVRRIAIDEESSSEGTLVGCWVSPYWSRRLTIDGHPEWPDVEGPEDERSGVALALVARAERRGRVSVCGYLVDVYCLGVKNALGPRLMPADDLAEFAQTYFGAFPEPLAAPLELAQHLVFGAVEYARRLGFAPHPDFHAASGHLGPWTGPSAIGFGRDGKPFYVEGPYDNGWAILRTLDRSVGRDNYHFIVSL